MCASKVNLPKSLMLGNPSLRFAQDEVKPVMQPEYVPGKLLVRFDESALAPSLSTLASLGRSTATMKLASARLPIDVQEIFRSLRGKMGMTSIFAPATLGLHRAQGASLSRHLNVTMASVDDSRRDALRGITSVDVDPATISESLITKMSEAKGVRFVERMPARYFQATSSQVVADPAVNTQWALRTMGWFLSQRPSARHVSVAVIDSGVDDKHPDLVQAIRNYYTQGQTKQDFAGHGTHVSGIIAAAANNGIGIAGMADCKVDVWKIVRDGVGDGTTVDGDLYLQALAGVLDTDAKIVNLSLGGVGFGRTEQDLIAELISDGRIVVAAMGNQGANGNPTTYPANYPDVVSVGAIKVTLMRAEFSNTGPRIKICAPGAGILSTLPRKKSTVRSETDYAAWDGTSMAAPHVSGALVLAYANGKISNAQDSLALLKAKAKTLVAMGGRSFTKEYGHGLAYLPNLL